MSHDEPGGAVERKTGLVAFRDTSGTPLTKQVEDLCRYSYAIRLEERRRAAEIVRAYTPRAPLGSLALCLDDLDAIEMLEAKAQEILR